MGFLDRAIKRGIGNAVGNAVEKGVRRAVEPKIEQAATNVINSAANRINTAGTQQPAQTQVNQAEINQAAGTIGGLFGSYAGAMQNFANEAAKNMKICPACGEGARAGEKFCPSCGSALPEQTAADGALCSSCGKQNDIGKKFCSACGAKLPFAVAEENAARERDNAVMARWDSLIPQYPKWCFGGNDYELFDNGPDENGRPVYIFSARNTNYAALSQYKELLKANGFKKPVRYMTDEELYKVTDGVSYSFNTSEPFSGDAGFMSVMFHIREFDETPEKKKQSGLRGLFGI